MALISKNKAGDFTPSQVAKLLSVRDNYADERWRKAMVLFEESYRVRDVSYSIEFFTKDNQGKDKAIMLNFSVLPVELEDTTENKN
ncbi:MAG: DUF3164 family protein [Bacteroidales bacterium]|nr:DUF3164 family protein [Bacteroidales bacterium]